MTQYDRRTAIINPVGGKIKNPIRGLNKAITGLNKINPVMMAVKDPTLNKGMRQLGKFTNKELLPAVVSTGIPLASTALGALATMYGGPMAGEMASSLSENLMKEYIPDRYQSKNKYVGLLSDAIQAGVSQDPNELLGVQSQFMDTVESDLARKKPRYDPENPYSDLMAQLQNKYPQYYSPPPIPQQTGTKQPEQIVENDNAIYGNSELGEGADSLVIKTPPYQQKEGSVSGMLGGKLKKSKKPKKSKVIEEEIEVYIKKKLPHKKFSHPKNSSLDQLLEAEAEKKEAKSKKAMEKMIEKQTKALTAMGFGVSKRPVKGSQEAKDKMAKLRAMRKKK